MKLIYILFFTIIATVSGICERPRVRKEWRYLSISKRIEYLQAVRCLLAKPPQSRTWFPQVTNRYEDFVALHVNGSFAGWTANTQVDFTDPRWAGYFQRYAIHNTPRFLPWHRYYLWLFENALSDECGWNDGLPYWDWNLGTAEAGGSWETSPIFSASYGFGGNGASVNVVGNQYKPSREVMARPGVMNSYNRLLQLSSLAFGAQPSVMVEENPDAVAGCVTDGPFKRMRLHIGPLGLSVPNNTRCLTRRWDQRYVNVATQRYIRQVLQSRTYGEFVNELQRSFTVSSRGRMDSRVVPHTIGHVGVGGEMLDPISSANDPLFMLHHANLDRLWALWQEKDGARNLWDLRPSATNRGPDSFPLNLLDTIEMGFAGPDVVVGHLMDTMNRYRNGILCYQYDLAREGFR